MTDLPTHCFPGAWWKAERGPRGTASSCSVSSRLCQDRKRAVAAASRWTGGFPHSSGIAAGSRLFIATFWIEIIWIISRYGFPDPSMKTQWQIFSPSPCYLQFQCTNTRLQGQRLTRSTVRAQLNPHSLPGSKGSACLSPGTPRDRQHVDVASLCPAQEGRRGGTGPVPGAPCEAETSPHPAGAVPSAPPGTGPTEHPGEPRTAAPGPAEGRPRGS